MFLLEHGHLWGSESIILCPPLDDCQPEMTDNKHCVFVTYREIITLKKGAMPIPELTSGCIMGDLVVLYIFYS